MTRARERDRESTYIYIYDNEIHKERERVKESRYIFDGEREMGAGYHSLFARCDPHYISDK